jgi:PDZ domain
VYKVRHGSLLEGKVAVGDIIISINGTDTRGMTATTVTLLMKDTSSESRTIVLLSHSPDTHDEPSSADTPSVMETEIFVSPSIIVENESEIFVGPDTATTIAGVIAATRNVIDEATTPTAPEGMWIKTVTAPAGRLLLVIDTTKQGPQVHKIRDGSPMEGKLDVGDIIASIDGTDTRTMTSSAITNLMIETSSNERVMVVFTRSPLEENASDETPEPENKGTESIVPAADAMADSVPEKEPTVAALEAEPVSVVPEPAPVQLVASSVETKQNDVSAKLPAPPQSSLGENDGRKVKTIIAPPGKLGIVIDTKLEGPVVFKIKEGSPLIGKVEVGDIITDIDGTDTRAMSASGITALMVKTAKSQRKITLLSKD